MTQEFSGTDIHHAVERAAHALIAARDRLNAADARLGDGDTGTMLARAAAAVLRNLPATGTADPTVILRAVAHSVAGDTGSSLGTLLALGLRRCAEHLAPRRKIAMTELSAALAAAASQMRVMGGSQPGDKTIVDFLDEMVRQTGQGASSTEVRVAGRQILDDYRSRSCRIGRARLYPAASQGADDPGMLAGLTVLEAICETSGCEG